MKIYWAHTMCQTPHETLQIPKRDKEKAHCLDSGHSQQNHAVYNYKSVSQEQWKHKGKQAYPSLGHQGGFPEEVTAEKSLRILKEEEISQRRRESRHSRQKYQSLEKEWCGREQGVAGD